MYYFTAYLHVIVLLVSIEKEISFIFIMFHSFILKLQRFKQFTRSFLHSIDVNGDGAFLKFVHVCIYIFF